MSDQPDARRIVAALKGKWRGQNAMARCPAHADKGPSLSLKVVHGTVLVYCFAGCSQAAVIGALQDMGLWPHREERGHPSYPHMSPVAGPDPEAEADDVRRSEIARDIWRQAHKPAQGTPVETYLRARGITRSVPASLAFAPHLKHPTGRRSHAMIAGIQDGNGRLIAVQRTWLLPDGSGKAALEPAKATLGPMKDGAVRLAHAGETLGIAEGVETGLSAMQLFWLPVWVSLGTARMKAIALPKHTRRIIIFRDPGEPGVRAANEASTAFAEQGKTVIVQNPPAEGDWNDHVRAARGAA